MESKSRLRPFSSVKISERGAYYSIRFVCDNCGAHVDVWVPKGIRLSELDDRDNVECVNCGCTVCVNKTKRVN